MDSFVFLAPSTLRIVYVKLFQHFFFDWTHFSSYCWDPWKSRFQNFRPVVKNHKKSQKILHESQRNEYCFLYWTSNNNTNLNYWLFCNILKWVWEISGVTLRFVNRFKNAFFNEKHTMSSQASREILWNIIFSLFFRFPNDLVTILFRTLFFVPIWGLSGRELKVN